MRNSNTPSDPREPSRETRLTLPKSWKAETVDAVGSLGMFFAGMVMVTRNRYAAWPVLILAMNGVMNQHPLRAKEGGSTPWATFIFRSWYYCMGACRQVLRTMKWVEDGRHRTAEACSAADPRWMALFGLVVSHVPLFTITDPTTGAIRFS